MVQAFSDSLVPHGHGMLFKVGSGHSSASINMLTKTKLIIPKIFVDKTVLSLKKI
jgi:uncharacterized membrane protein (UPF0127 family)